jgi:hypothetical protein
LFFDGMLTKDEKTTGSMEPNRTEPWHRTRCHMQQQKRQNRQTRSIARAAIKMKIVTKKW